MDNKAHRTHLGEGSFCIKTGLMNECNFSGQFKDPERFPNALLLGLKCLGLVYVPYRRQSSQRRNFSLYQVKAGLVHLIDQ